MRLMCCCLGHRPNTETRSILCERLGLLIRYHFHTFFVVNSFFIDSCWTWLIDVWKAQMKPRWVSENEEPRKNRWNYCFHRVQNEKKKNSDLMRLWYCIFSQMDGFPPVSVVRFWQGLELCGCINKKRVWGFLKAVIFMKFSTF